MLIAFDLQVRLRTKRLKGDCDLNLTTVTEHVLTLICVHFGAKLGQLMIMHAITVISAAEELRSAIGLLTRDYNMLVMLRWR